MSIRKRTWNTRMGMRAAWIVDYSVFDAKQGKRLRAIKTFKRERDARDFAATTHVQIRDGMHVPASASITVADAGDKWLQDCRAVGLEGSTIDQYDQHLRLHIKPFLGHLKLPQLTVPSVAEFQNLLRTNGRSAAMVRGVTGSLRAIYATAQEQGTSTTIPSAPYRAGDGGAVMDLTGTRRNFASASIFQLPTKSAPSSMR